MEFYSEIVDSILYFNCIGWENLIMKSTIEYMFDICRLIWTQWLRALDMYTAHIIDNVL